MRVTRYMGLHVTPGTPLHPPRTCNPLLVTVSQFQNQNTDSYSLLLPNDRLNCQTEVKKKRNMSTTFRIVSNVLGLLCLLLPALSGKVRMHS